MTKDNKIIQSLWIGKLSSMEKLSMLSFLRHGHEYHLYTYGPVEDVPDGVIIKDANEIIRPDDLDYRKFKRLALFADCFRYRLLHYKGGWWVDTDVICLKPFNFFCSHVFARESKDWINNGIIKAPLYSSIMEYCWFKCLGMNPADVEWSETGPKLLTAAVKELHMEKNVEPMETFCPVPWSEAKKFVTPGEAIIVPPEAYAVHLWNEAWSWGTLDKDKFPRGTFYSRVKKELMPQPRPDLSDTTAIIKTFLRDKCLFRCVQTLKNSYPSIHIMVADDGHPSREKREQLTSMGVDQYIELPWNRGLSAGRNALLDAVCTPYVLLCDDDFSFTNDARIENMRHLMDISDIAAGLVYNMRNWTLCNSGVGWDITGGNFVDAGETPVIIANAPVTGYDGIRYEEYDFVLNFFIAKTDVLRKIRWDESLYITFEHIDFALRAKNMGVKSVRTRDAFVFHKELAVADEGYLKIRADYKKYQQVFRDKWGFEQPIHAVPMAEINEPTPKLPDGMKLEPYTLSPPQLVAAPPLPREDWKKSFLAQKVDRLVGMGFNVAICNPSSMMLASLRKRFPAGIEENIETPLGQRTLFCLKAGTSMGKILQEQNKEQ